METVPERPMERIPDQTAIPWEVAFSVSWGSLKRRVLRSLITMMGVILAIAFLTYMLVTDNVNKALIRANTDALNLLLQNAGIDIFQGGKTDTRMLLLIGLSLLTCLVGIVNSMLMSVTERIREIGTMKCLGALDSFILKIYFIEAALQGIIGTLLGLCVGLLVALAVSLQYFRGYVLTSMPYADIATSLVTAFFIGALISILAAIVPAQWAARKEPVDAMRREE